MGVRDLHKGRAGKEQPQGTDSFGEPIFLHPSPPVAPPLWGSPPQHGVGLAPAAQCPEGYVRAIYLN